MKTEDPSTNPRLAKLYQEFGRVLQAVDVARYLGVDATRALGGMRLGRRILFFENKVIKSIKEHGDAILGQEFEGISAAVDGGEISYEKFLMPEAKRIGMNALNPSPLKTTLKLFQQFTPPDTPFYGSRTPATAPA